MTRFLVLSSAILFLISSIISPSLGVTDDTLKTICSQTHDEGACVKMLKSDENAISADLPKLSLISFELTLKQAEDNLQMFADSLNTNDTIAVIGEAFNNCVGVYLDMIPKIKEAYQFSQQKKYEDISPLDDTCALADGCARGLQRLNCLEILEINDSMKLKCETSSSVYKYMRSA